LTPEQAPPDAGQYSEHTEELPYKLQVELSRLGVR
jgi:hypothetical protein